MSAYTTLKVSREAALKALRYRIPSDEMLEKMLNDEYGKYLYDFVVCYDGTTDDEETLCRISNS